MLVPLLVAAIVTVAATTTDLRDLVAAVGGDRVRVESLTTPRQDPHSRELHPRQVVSLQRADLLVRIGLDHEPWLPRALARVRRPPRDLDCSRAVILLGTETPRLRADRGEHVHAFGNPHYWLDPENARPITARILEALRELAPADSDALQANRARFLARLDAGLTRWTAALRPHAGARIVVVHDTWPYFARRFQLTVAGTLEERPGIAPSPAYLGGVIERMKRSRVEVIVAEPGAPAALLDRVVGATGARIATLAPSVGGDPDATDYLALFDVNVRRLKATLDGSTAPR